MFFDILMFILDAVSRNGFVIQYLSPEFRKDREIILPAIYKFNITLINVPQELRGDPEIVLTLVNKRGIDLKYASPDLKNDLLLQSYIATMCHLFLLVLSSKCDLL